MKTPEQEAYSLFHKFLPLVEAFSFESQDDNAKKCALITLDFAKKSLMNLNENGLSHYITGYINAEEFNKNMKYTQEQLLEYKTGELLKLEAIKKEIKKL